MKKRGWLPTYRGRKFVDHGGPDAVVSRFVSGGIVLHIVESRGILIVMAKGREEPLDMRTANNDSLPACFGEIFLVSLFDKIKPQFRERSALRGGGEIHLAVLPEIALPKGAPALITSVVWTPDVLAVGMAKRYHGVASPDLVLRRPLFGDPANEPYRREREQLKDLARSGSAAAKAGEIAALVKKAIAETPKTEAAMLEERGRDPERTRLRLELIRDGCSALALASKQASKEDSVKVRHACWQAIVSVVEVAPAGSAHTRELARKLVRSICRVGVSAMISRSATRRHRRTRCPPTLWRSPTAT